MAKKEQKKRTPVRAKQPRPASPQARAAWAKTAAKRVPCPSCPGALVERDGKRGKFLGCSRWPDCTYTQSIDPEADLYGDGDGDAWDDDDARGYEGDDFWNW